MQTLRAISTTVLVFALSGAALGERPNLTPEVLQREATHVVVGQVKAVYARQVVTARQGPGTIETHYLVEIELASIEKGDGLSVGDLAYVRCWRITRGGPELTVGPSGHRPLPEEGDRVRAYVVKGPYGATLQQDNGITAVYPNGFEILPATSD